MNKNIRWIANAFFPITFLLFSFEDLNSQRLEKLQFSNLNPVCVVVLSPNFSNCSSLLPGQCALGEVIAKVGLLFIPASKTNALKGAQVIISKFFKILPSMNRWGSSLPYLKEIIKDINKKGDDFFNYIRGILKPRGYDALQNHPGLRTDVELLKKLDKYLEGKGDDEIKKIKDILDQFPEDKSKRRIIENVSNAGRNIYTDLNAFLSRIAGNVDEVKNAFTNINLEYTKHDLVLYRHCNKVAPQVSNWYTNVILSKSDARSILALPNFNSAQRIIKIMVPSGTPYITGRVSSQIANSSGLFGSYATGGGTQFYFLDEYKSILNVLDDFPNPN